MSDASRSAAAIASVEQLEEMLSQPTPAVVDAMRQLKGDILILGVAGKMGPTLARMARRASDAAAVQRRIIGVARFSSPSEAEKLQQHGIEPLKCDLLDRAQLARLPDVPNLVYMPGMKFGAAANESLTWAMNAWLPAIVCERFARSRIVAFSTGNVYGLTPLTRGGSVESDAPNPQGEYAMSCLGRERMLEHFSRTLDIPMSIIRLNYAVEMRYGVLVDLARKVWSGAEIDLSMGAFNAIWQADASAHALAAFAHAASPPFLLNVSGPEQLSVRRVCQQFASLMNRPVTFTGVESADALLNNAQLSHRLYGYPRVSADQIVRWIADWIMRGGETLNKPTHFETRDGRF